jgi:hypothetical protein
MQEPKTPLISGYYERSKFNFGSELTIYEGCQKQKIEKRRFEWSLKIFSMS